MGVLFGPPITSSKFKQIVYNTILTRSTTAVDPQHLKFKEWDISLTKNYWIIIKTKTITSIHIFIFKTQVLGSHELKSHCHFSLNQLSVKIQSKMTESTFSLPAFVVTRKKSAISSVQFWDKVNFRVPWPDRPHLFLTMPTQ